MNKRVLKFILIGSLHSSLYLWILPKVILPNIEEEYKMIASITATTVSILLTILIARKLRPSSSTP